MQIADDQWPASKSHAMDIRTQNAYFKYIKNNNKK